MMEKSGQVLEIIFRIILWGTTLLVPWLIWNDIPTNDRMWIFSPTWTQIQYSPSFVFDQFSQITVGYVLFVQLYAYVGQTLVIADPIGLIFTLIPGFLIILPLLILELQPRYSWDPKYLPYVILWFPFVLILATMFLWIAGFSFIIIPVPVASALQFLRYRQTRSRYVHKIKEDSESVQVGDIRALRGGEFVGNRLRFKVKVANESKRVITDIIVTILSYPKDSLNLEGSQVANISKIEPGGFRSPTFDFLPTKDCVKGNILASVAYVDPAGVAQTTPTTPYTIRAVCDLLRPENITTEEFILKLSLMEHGETSSKVDEWSPEEMNTKSIQILKDSNFYEVNSNSEMIGDNVQFDISGWARGVYTNKSLGVEISIAGKPGEKGATCKIKMAGEDEAMIMPAIDEISQKLGAWLCPQCGGGLPIESVEDLKRGKSVSCPFCGVTLNR